MNSCNWEWLLPDVEGQQLMQTTWMHFRDCYCGPEARFKGCSVVQ